MVQKNLDKDNIITKGKVHTFLGDFNLYSVKSSLKPVFTFNVHSILLILVSLVVFIISAMNIGQLLNVFLLIVSIDLLISSLIVKPLNYYKNGYEITKSVEINRMFVNYELSSKEIKNFLKFFSLRAILYFLLTLTIIPINYPDLTKYRVYFYLLWSLIFSVLALIGVIMLILVGTGLLIDDYLNEGSTHKALRDLRLEISKSALELDKVITRINKSQNSVINAEYRSKLAGTLFKLRNYLVINNTEDETYTPEMKVRFIQTEKQYSQELLENLQRDKCVVCYSQLKNSHGPYLVCPLCGQGGHKDHIEEWFTSKSTCPGCKADLSSSSFLILT